jgi:putative nucleotidyltransferase with HDIG domain
VQQQTPKKALLVALAAQDVEQVRSSLLQGNGAWALALANNPNEAEAMLEADSSLRVVLAPPNLRGASGKLFLEDIATRHPNVACAWMGTKTEGATDASEARLGWRSVGPASALLERSDNLQRILTNEVAAKIVGQLQGLPAVPTIYRAVMKAAADPDTGVADIAKIIDSDPAMSLKVLQMVNSSYFGIRRKVTSTSQAVSYLGLELLKGLVLAANVFGALDGKTMPGFSPEHFQRYSLRVARIAQKFATGSVTPEAAHTAAILHDIGQMVLALRCPEDFGTAMERIGDGEAQEVVEREIFSVGHEEVGAHLLAAWGIPQSIVEAVAMHHRPKVPVRGESDLVAILHAAVSLVGIVTCGDPESTLDVSYLEQAGFAEMLPAWRRIVEEEAAAWANS